MNVICVCSILSTARPKQRAPLWCPNANQKWAADVTTNSMSPLLDRVSMSQLQSLDHDFLPVAVVTLFRLINPVGLARNLETIYGTAAACLRTKQTFHKEHLCVVGFFCALFAHICILPVIGMLVFNCSLPLLFRCPPLLLLVLYVSLGFLLSRVRKCKTFTVLCRRTLGAENSTLRSLLQAMMHRMVTVHAELVRAAL